MRLTFKSIRWRNFLSTGNQYTKILLDKQTTTLIVGENGAGKSTLLDALCFVLFGKAFRNINKPLLINSINDKDCVVEVEFNIGGKEYVVTRGIKPNIFSIMVDGVLLNQDAASRDYQKVLETQILKLNYKSFTQIVILGSASFTPFMQLPAAHRREIIEDLLDIKVFSTMNQVLKDKASEMKAQIQTIENQIDVHKTKIKLQKDYIQKLQDEQKRRQEDVQKHIDEANAELSRLSDLWTEEEAKALHLESQISDGDQKRTKKAEVEALLRKISERIKTTQGVITFYEQHDVCPTCNQDLEDAHKTHTQTLHQEKIQELGSAKEALAAQLEKIQTRLDEIADIEKEIAEHQKSLRAINSQIIAQQTYIKQLTRMGNLEEETSVGDSILEASDSLKAMAGEALGLVNQKVELNDEKKYLDIAGILLKDTGIKTKVVKQYLPVINKMVNKYLTAMDFFVSFNLDESFNEMIKSRHRDDFSYASFSEGEKSRIDLALLLTWRAIAKMKNSANTNLLILDEIFDGSLDNSGTELIMGLLNTLGEGTNLFCISHKGDTLFDKFRSVIQFEKHQNFSSVKAPVA